MNETQTCPCGSDRAFVLCHGKVEVLFTANDNTKPVVLAPPVTTVKLDLGAGQSPREGFEGVDLNAPDPKHRVDLFKFPWPWDDNSADELHASHFCEHIPARDIEERDLSLTEPKPAGPYDHPPVGVNRWMDARERFVGQDMFFAFFDECYRILKPGGKMTVIVPALQSVRAFQDPTHRRFIPSETFMYLSADWRKLNKLDHYRVKCDFQGNINHTCDPAMNQLHPEAAARRFRENWNTIYDWHVVLVSKK